jgi:ribonuclease HIII
VKPITSHTCKLTEEQGAQLQRLLDERNYKFSSVPYASFAAEQPGIKVVFYNSGKLVVQGKGTADFIEFVLEPEILKEAERGYEHVLKPELFDPRLGIDESGKGDFFGPLCIAGVYVNENIIKRWEDVGVKDSKRISSDRRILAIAEEIKKTPGCVYSVVPIGNEAYNRLYGKMRSVNTLLAWGHARVIENLMSQGPRMNPPPIRAISDQFARDKSTVEKSLMAQGRQIELVQRHKAEEDIAVAAASVLARDEFVRRLHEMGAKLGMELPKGASSMVDQTAKAIVETHGGATLEKISKMHFRTSFRALGLPEPERTEWKK